MSQNQQRCFQTAQIGGLMILLGLPMIGITSMATGFQPKAPPPLSPRLPNPTATTMSISEADAKTIENWLMGTPRERNPASAEPSVDFDRLKAVLARPNATSDLAKIVARQDLPPELRVYAQQILIETGQAANPILVEAYCQTIPNGFRHDVWGFPGDGVSSFGNTLVGYGQAALPCLRNLLDNQSKIGYTGELGAYSEGMRYRVSDLAAYFITQILNLPYNNDSNPAVRDQQIQALRQRLMIAPLE
jgi:hypothetical protein